MIKNRLQELTAVLFAFFLLSFSPLSASYSTTDPFVVVLDAGHGGHDPGNLGNGYLEKNIALNIVLHIGSILEKNPNIKVIYTRKRDTFVDLFVRGEIANKANADLFVSVHCDSHTSDAYGAGTFVLGLHANEQNFAIAKKENSVIYLEDNYANRYANYDINSPESVVGLTIMQEEFLDQSIALAKEIQDNFTLKLDRKDRKVKQAGFIVLHQTFMPSVLVETGFLTNKTEGAYLNSAKGQSDMGNAIANAILSYKENTIAKSIPNVVENKPSAPNPEPVVKAVEKKIAAPVEKVKDKKGVKKRTKIKEEPAIVKVDKKQQKEVVSVNEAGKPKIVTDKPITKEPIVVAAPSKEKVTPKKEEPIAVKEKVTVEFRVQLMASEKNLSFNDPVFKGLGDLTKEPVNKLYRYMHGSTDSWLKATLLKKLADAKGFPSSYIVAYKNGKRVDIEDAKKYAVE